MTSAAIRQEREQVLKELAGLEQIRRGSVTEQRIATVGPDGAQRTRGPYPLYTFKEDGKTFSRRLHGTAEVAAYPSCAIFIANRSSWLFRSLSRSCGPAPRARCE